VTADGEHRHDGGPADDLIQPFQIERPGLRGRMVRLGGVADAILSRHAYPEPVGELLGEALALAATLAAALKYDGVFTLQTKGDGPVRLLVADVTTDGALRGYAEFDGERLDQILEGPPAAPVPRLLGAGYLAFTVDQGEYTNRYQGIVDLDGATLADCAQHYFRQSEQLQTVLRLAAGHDPTGAWRAAGIMVQRLPGDDHDYDTVWDVRAIDKEKADDDWRRTAVLLGSATDEELLDPGLPAPHLLFRLFHEDGVRVYEPRAVADQCRCSRERVTRMLKGLDRASVKELMEDGRIVVTCQFCSRDEVFTEAQIDAL
jgi:molecular chaperone Hsp33